MKTIIRQILGMLLPLGLLFLLPLTARANPVDPISDWLRIYDPSGAIAYEVSVTESQEAVNGANQVYYIPYPGLVDVSQFKNPTVLHKASGPLQGQAADIFGVGVINYGLPGGGFFLAFASDSETEPAYHNPTNALINYVKTHEIWDATMYLAPDLRAQGWTAEFYTTLYVAPLPGAMLLLGSGLLGLAVLRKKQL
jgi:hypothetical protein